MMKAPCGHEEGLFDYGEAVRRLDGQPDLFGMIASILAEDCPRDLEAMRTALDAGNAEALAFCAHKMKGSLSAIAANPARAAARKLEVLGREGDLAAAREAYPDLEQRIRALLVALSPYLQREA